MLKLSIVIAFKEDTQAYCALCAGLGEGCSAYGTKEDVSLLSSSMCWACRHSVNLMFTHECLMGLSSVRKVEQH